MPRFRCSIVTAVEHAARPSSIIYSENLHRKKYVFHDGHGGRAVRASGGSLHVAVRKISGPCVQVPTASSWRRPRPHSGRSRSEEHTSELQSLMRISYAVFCLKKKKTQYEIKI